MLVSTIAASLVAATAVSAADVMVMVGQNGQNLFSPDSVTAAMGDTIRFMWGSGFHGVASTDFTTPCKSNNMFASPVMMAGGNTPEWLLVINSTSPTFVYCPVGDHCAEGMSMVINPASGGNETIMSYQSASKNAQSGMATPKGGLLSNETSSSTSSSASSSTKPSMTASGSSMPASSSMTNGAGLLGAGAGAMAAGVAGIAFML